MTKEYFKEPVKVVRLWVHECERVLMDRMVSDTDMLKFGDFRVNITKKHFDDVPQVRTAASLVLRHPVLTCSGMHSQIHSLYICLATPMLQLFCWFYE